MRGKDQEKHSGHVTQNPAACNKVFIFFFAGEYLKKGDSRDFAVVSFS